jgi:hypothetical protein
MTSGIGFRRDPVGGKCSKYDLATLPESKVPRMSEPDEAWGERGPGVWCDGEVDGMPHPIIASIATTAGVTAPQRLVFKDLPPQELRRTILSPAPTQG